MRFVQIKYAKPGMCVARDIQDSYGGTLVTAQSALTGAKIRKLDKLGYAGVYITDALSEDIEVEDMLSHETRMKGMECIKQNDIEGCREVAINIVDEIMHKGVISLDITDLRSFDDFVFAHSVNVAVYACIIAIGMGHKSEFLSKLVLASLVHDLGKMSVPKEILNKKERLTPEEYAIMKEHAQRSFEMIVNRKDISDYVKDAVLHHHENVDGSGYPDGIEGKDQSAYIRILHVADVYDALISKRPYKEPYSPCEAVEYLMGACDIMFDRSVVDALIRYVPLFPLGTEVVLSDGSHAIIYYNSGFHNLRPIVRLFDGSLMDLANPEYINIVITALENVAFQTIENAEHERRKMVEAAVKFRILVVDDMLTNHQKLQAILGAQYDLIYMKSGDQAISHLKKNGVPDLILLDIDMPDMDGMATARMIRTEYEEVPILFMASGCDKQTILRCKEMHMAGYIIKPYQATFIRSEIRRILNGRGEYE